MTSWRPAALALLLFGLAAPYLAMIVHLNFSRELTADEKGPWRNELWWGHRAIVAVWWYLLSADLRQASQALAAEGRPWWRP